MRSAGSLGYEFLRKFYYLDLVRDDLIKCILYRHNEQYCGFVVFTAYPQSFIKTGKRKHPFKLACLVCKEPAFAPQPYPSRYGRK